MTPEELLGTPLLLARREEVRKELAGWFGDSFDRLEIAGTFNLILNAANMVRNGVGAALGFYIGNLSDELRFVPQMCIRDSSITAQEVGASITLFVGLIWFMVLIFGFLGVQAKILPAYWALFIIGIVVTTISTFIKNKYGIKE